MNSSLPYLKRRTYNTTSVRTDELKFTPKIHCTLLGGTHTELNTICRTRFIGEKKMNPCMWCRVTIWISNLQNLTPTPSNNNDELLIFYLYEGFSGFLLLFICVLGDLSSLEGFVHARSVPFIRLIHLYFGLYT